LLSREAAQRTLQHHARLRGRGDRVLRHISNLKKAHLDRDLPKLAGIGVVDRHRPAAAQPPDRPAVNSHAAAADAPVHQTLCLLRCHETYHKIVSRLAVLLWCKVQTARRSAAADAALRELLHLLISSA